MSPADEAVADAAEILIGDYKRKGQLDSLDVARLVEKRRLDEPQLEQLLELLAAEGIEFGEEAPPDFDAEEVGASFFGGSNLPKPPSVEEERRLGNAVQASIRMRGTSEDIGPAARAIIERGDAARDELIRRNIRLVYWVARHRTGGSLDLDDLVQEGIKGLIRAVEKFNPQLGYKFSTYATWWIKQAIARGIDDTGDTIRIPVHRREMIRRVRRMRRQLKQEKGREPSLNELAAALDWTLERTAFIDDLSRFRHLELDAPVADDSTLTLGDLIPDNQPSPEDLAVQMSLRETIAAALEPFPERTQHILRARFGIDADRSQTLEEIGQHYGVTRERIRQIEAKALNKLRKASRRNRLKTFVE